MFLLCACELLILNDQGIYLGDQNLLLSSWHKISRLRMCGLCVDRTLPSFLVGMSAQEDPWCI